MKLHVDGFLVEGDEDEVTRLLANLLVANGVAEPALKKGRPATPDHDPTNEHPYWSAPLPRHSQRMADTYDYIASFKKGRTLAQVCQWFEITKSTAQSRLGRLQAYGLIHHKKGYGEPWVAVK